MKYVIFKKETDDIITYLPVIIPEHVTHSSIKIDESNGRREPVNKNKITVHSAGFFHINGGMVKIQPERSESLNIGPNMDTDQILIHQTLSNAGIYGFTSYK